MAYTQVQDWTLIVNGHRVTGYSDRGQGITFPRQERQPARITPEGNALNFLAGPKGGLITVRLFPTSASIRQFAEWHTAMLKDRIVKLSGSISNSRWNARAVLRNGAMRAGPAFYSFGNDVADMEYTLFFGEIIGNMSGLNFDE